MKDTELRAVVLQALYDKRRDEKRYLGYEDFDLDISKDDFLRIADQLEEHGLIEWKPLIGSQGQRVDGRGYITGDGVSAIETDGEDSPLRIEMPVTQNINISHSQGIQVGDHNTQNIVSAIESIIHEIEASDASPAEKAEAKSKIKDAITHPLTAATFGAGLAKLLELL